MHPNAKNRTRQQERVWYLNLSTNDNQIWFEYLEHVNKCNCSYVYKLTVNGITLHIDQVLTSITNSNDCNKIIRINNEVISVVFTANL